MTEKAKQGLLVILFNFIKDIFNKAGEGDLTPLITIFFVIGCIAIAESLIHAWLMARKGEELQWTEHPLKYGVFGGISLFLGAGGLTLMMTLMAKATPEAILGP